MKVDCAIITMLPEEFVAVQERFTPSPYVDPSSHRTYGISQIQTREGKTCVVAIARTSRQGNDASQQLASQIISDLDPQLLLVVGIAGGTPDHDFALGDVIVSSHIHNFDLSAIQGHQTTFDVTGGIHPDVSNIVANLYLFQPQLAAWNSEASIGVSRPTLLLTKRNVKRFLDTAIDQAWREKVEEVLLWHFDEEQRGKRPPKFLPGTIASSNSLVRSDAVLVQWLQNAHSIRAVEMEAAGVYQAAQQMRQQYPVMAIRGISEIIGSRRSADWKNYACHTAAAFAYAFISAGIVKPSEYTPSPVSEETISASRKRGAEKKAPDSGQTRHKPGSNDVTALSRSESAIVNRQRRALSQKIGCLVGVIAVAGYLLFRGATAIFSQQNHAPPSTLSPSLATQVCLDEQKQGIKDGIGVLLKNNDCIGISDGNAVFDLKRDKAAVQQQLDAVRSFNEDSKSAVTQSRWEQVIASDLTIAEPRIYDEDIHVQTSSRPYVTLIVAVILSGQYGYDGAEVLQGVYLQQKGHNDDCQKNNYNKCVLLNVLIANIGSGVQDESDYTEQVTDQMAEAIKHDPTIVGVMSGVTSQGTINIRNELNKKSLQTTPVVASKATIDSLSGTANLFRVVPPDIKQAQAAADFARNVLQAKRVGVLYRGKNTYGLNLEGDFSSNFSSLDKTYQLAGLPTGFDPTHAVSIENALESVLQSHPDLLYCACYALDVNTILQWLAHHSAYKDLKILGGDPLYELAAYTPDTRSQWDRLYFTTFTYPDLWDILKPAAIAKPQGIDDYKKTYGVGAGDGQYGSTRMTPNISVAYDAMLVLAMSCNQVVAQHGNVTPLDLEHAIAQQNIIGISGRISFGRGGGSESDPDNKIIVVVQIVDQHFQYANFEEGAFV